MNSARLDGKRAIVVGGCGGIGSAICARFALEGAEVTAVDVVEGEKRSDVEFKRLDSTDENAVKRFFEDFSAARSSLEVLVNAAGLEIEKTIENTSLEEWNRIFAVNVTGAFLVSKHALPLLRNSEGASIINFGSYDGFIADPGLAAYCATKGAVHALTRAMACDHGPEGIRVNAICPGFVDTPMLQSFFGDSGDIASLRKAVCDIHPMRRYGTPDDIAGLALWLASDEATYASGQLWIMDGGLTAQVQQMRL